MSSQSNNCVIWPDFEASYNVLPLDLMRGVVSERAGGEYRISMQAALSVQRLSDAERARLTTWLVDQRLQGNEWPVVTVDIVEDAISRRPLTTYDRAERLIRLVDRKSESVGTAVTVSTDALMAWSESTNREDVEYFIRYLAKNAWLSAERTASNGFRLIVSMDGHSRLADRAASVDTFQVFIAMWFDSSMDEPYRNGVAPAVRDAGYNPLRIDQKEHINKIDDEIIAEIRRSKFLIADFTQGNDGARGGVYYEAGFAHGLGLPVIFMCRDNALESLHFDTNHYNHIVWTDSADLREKLTQRILAVIGTGPAARQQS